MKRIAFSLIALAALSAHAQRPCTAGSVSLTFSGEDGEFAGMSHNGAWVMVQNTGKRTCTVPKRLPLAFRDTTGKPLNITLNLPDGSQKEPSSTPVRLAPGKTARTKMQWVSGEVYDHSVCADVATAVLDLPGGPVTAQLPAHMCGNASDGIHFDEEWLRPMTKLTKQQ